MSTKKKTVAKKSPVKVNITRNVGEPHAGGMPDRVWFSCGLTINAGNYESIRIDGGISTDVEPQETVIDAMRRCQETSISEINRQAEEVRSSLGQPPPKKHGRG